MRPRARIQDFLWAGAALWFAGSFVIAAVSSITRGDESIGWRLARLALMALVAYWIAMGCWNRSVWGARGRLRPPDLDSPEVEQKDVR